MKRTKRIISLMLTFALVLAMSAIPVSVSAATYSDISGAACETAVNVLSGLGVVNGYNENGKTYYKPDNTVTRAEMAKLLVVAMGRTSEALADDTGFNDVASTHWAAKYVAYAASKSIINGYGNGKFGPSDTVTYDQAQKMIVGALGYTNECTEMQGQWNEVYPAKAAELGITNGISGSGSAGASRGDCAIMLYNAINVANVYADLNGNVTLMPGNATVTFDGQETTGLNWISRLIVSGGARYEVIGLNDANKSSVAITDHVGQAASVFMNNRGSIISYLGSDTQLIKGNMSDDGKTFTANGKKYTFENTTLKTFASIDDGTAIDAKYVPYLFSGAMSSIRDSAGKYSGEVVEINNGVLQIINTNAATPATVVTGTCTLTVKMDGDSIAEIWAVNRTSTFSGRTQAYEIPSNTNPVLYWTVISIKENDSIKLKLTATEAGRIGYSIDSTPMVHLADTPFEIKQGNNEFTVSLSKAGLEKGEKAYLHIGFTGVSGAQMVTAFTFENKTATYN